MNTKYNKKLGIVLSGGGARGAYEAGIIHYIRTMLPEPYKSRAFDIYTGSSVGAINASFTAATAHDLEYQGQKILELWATIKEENIYKRDMKALLNFVKNSSKGVITNLIFGSERSKSHFQSFLDTKPLIPFLENAIVWKNITKNTKSGVIKALALIATNVFTGRPELFGQIHESIKYTGDYVFNQEKITAVHAASSAAIPLIFPAQLINGTAYIDGGLRLNTPMSPAIQLGADALLVISLHHPVKKGEPAKFSGQKGKPPSTGQVLGRVMNSLFLDRIQYDIEQLERINRIIEWSEMKFGADYLHQINQMLEEKNIIGDIANRGLKKLNVLRIDPSVDLGEMFMGCYQKEQQSHFTPFERLLVRILDINPTSGFDFLSYITFMPSYIKMLLDIGFEDAKTNRDKLMDFLGQ